MSVSRRGVLGGAATAAAASWWGFGAVAQASPPRVAAGRLDALRVGEPVWFGYPDGRSPAVMMKLGRPVPHGIGPERDVVAFSAVCTHLGCPVAARDDRLVCPCHGSMFDPALGGQCYQGPAPTALPQLRLDVDADGALWVVGADAPIWGRHDEGSP
jgi:arsenite oxidase small subunit